MVICPFLGNFICLNNHPNMAKSDTAQATASANDSKLKALQTTIEKLDKAFGKGTVMRLSESKVVDVPVISTGSLGLDLALGIGGLPRGRVVEIYGPESSGKTTLTMHCHCRSSESGWSGSIHRR